MRGSDWTNETDKSLKKVRLSPGDQVLGPTAAYEVLGLLGAGGEGSVYLAVASAAEGMAEIRQSAPTRHRLCTLKVAANQAGAGRLSAEASLLASLDHPGVPRPLELFDWRGLTCLAAEYRAGRTLEMVQREAKGPLAPEQVVHWARQICDILAYLHSQPLPVVHRDIKPANLLLGDDGAILLLDFDAARHFDAQKPGDTIALGSPEYAAPEQFQGGRSNPRSDLWGLGATCFKLLTGSGPDRLFVFPPLREVLPSAPVLLESILQRALQYEPANRYGSAEEMRLDLERAGALLGEASAADFATAFAQASAAAEASAMPETPPVPLPRYKIRRTQPQRPGADRLVLAASLLSPLISALIVGFTVYLATATRSPLGFSQQPLGANPVGALSVTEVGLGEYVISTTPAGAAVEVDGWAMQNRTPLRLSRLEAGTHQVRLLLPGYAPEERVIDVQAGVTGELVTDLLPLVRLNLGLMVGGKQGAWAPLGGTSVAAPALPELAFRLDTEGLHPNSSSVTLQMVLRSPEGATRTLYSGPYRWGQPRLLGLSTLDPGAYVIEVTVLGPDLPPVSTRATFSVSSAN